MIPSNPKKQSRLCGACYTAINELKVSGGHDWDAKMCKQMRISTTLGCAGCNLPICEACWSHFNHVSKRAERDFSDQVKRVTEGLE